MDYTNLKAYGLSALAGAAMMTSAQAQEIGAEYKNKEASAVAEYTFNRDGVAQVTPRAIVGDKKDLSLKVAVDGKRGQLYLAPGVAMGEENYAYAQLGGCLYAGDKYALFGNAAVSAQDEAKVTEDIVPTADAGIARKLGDTFIARVGANAYVFDEGTKMGGEAALVHLPQSRKWWVPSQVSVGYNSNDKEGTVNAGLTWGARESQQEYMNDTSSRMRFAKKTAYKNVESEDGQVYVQVTKPNGNVTYTTTGGISVGESIPTVTENNSTSGITGTPVYKPTPGGSQGGTYTTPGTTIGGGSGSGLQTNTENPAGATNDNKPNQGGSIDIPVVDGER